MPGPIGDVYRCLKKAVDEQDMHYVKAAIHILESIGVGNPVKSEEPVCISCNKPGTDEDPLFETVHPYRHDMNGDDELVWMHHDCYSDSLGDI